MAEPTRRRRERPWTATTSTAGGHGDSPPPVRYLVPKWDAGVMAAIDALCREQPFDEVTWRRLAQWRDVIGFVTSLDGQPAGFCVCRLHARSVLIMHLLVHPDQRRRGCGRALLDATKARCSPTGRFRARVLCSDRDLGSHLFLRANDFQATRVLHVGHPETGDDAYQFDWLVPQVGTVDQDGLCF